MEPEQTMQEEYIQPQQLLALILAMKDMELARKNLQIEELKVQGAKLQLKAEYHLTDNDEVDVKTGKICRK